MKLIAIMARLAVTKATAIATGRTLVNIVAIASKPPTTDVTVASIIDTVTFHKASSIEFGGPLGKGFSSVKHLGRGFSLDGFSNGAKGSSKNKSGQEDKGLGVHCSTGWK
jgi:hypothetical protein